MLPSSSSRITVRELVPNDPSSTKFCPASVTAPSCVGSAIGSISAVPICDTGVRVPFASTRSTTSVFMLCEAVIR